jgi:predicted RNase H-like HicB family nuclease
MNVMTYKGYAARIEYSDEDQLLIGHVAGIRDVIGFHGESVAELREAFEEAVEADHIADSRHMANEQLIFITVFDAGCVALVGHYVHGVTPACSRNRRASRT